MKPALRRRVLFAALVAAVMASAVGAVYAKHENRKLFMELQALTEERDRLEVDWSRLQIEQSTWSTHARVEQLARGEMRMRNPGRELKLRVVAPMSWSGRRENRARSAQSFQLRWGFACGVVVLLGLALVGRAVHLQVFNKDFLISQADARHLRTAKISANRGVISDRNGEPLAASMPVDSLWVSPQELAQAPEQHPGARQGARARSRRRSRAR